MVIFLFASYNRRKAMRVFTYFYNPSEKDFFKSKYPCCLFCILRGKDSMKINFLCYVCKLQSPSVCLYLYVFILQHISLSLNFSYMLVCSAIFKLVHTFFYSTLCRFYFYWRHDNGFLSICYNAFHGLWILMFTNVKFLGNHDSFQ